MSDADYEDHRRLRREAGAGSITQWLAVFAAIVAALSIVVLAIDFRSSEGFRPSGIIGSMQAVTLIGGQIYFGTLTAVNAEEIRLQDVFEGVTTVNSQTQQRSTQLMSRKASAWHAPSEMTIRSDKILFTETIGPESTVGKAIKGGTSPPPAQ